MSRRMLSIASSPGWCARFEPDGAHGEERTIMLVSWALVEEADGTTAVVGVVQRSSEDGSPGGTLGLVDEVAGFRGYTFTGLKTKDISTP